MLFAMQARSGKRETSYLEVPSFSLADQLQGFREGLRPTAKFGLDSFQPFLSNFLS